MSNAEIQNIESNFSWSRRMDCVPLRNVLNAGKFISKLDLIFVWIVLEKYNLITLKMRYFLFLFRLILLNKLSHR